MTEQPLLPSQILDAAADLIEPVGAWNPRCYFVLNGENCWLGDKGLGEATTMSADAAVSRAAGLLSDGYVSPLLNAAWDAFECALGESVEGYERAPGRTQAEVVAALRKAAELARSEGQ